jgi:hypothetical protein
MIHERIRSFGHEWVWEAGRFEIELRVYTDLPLNPSAEGFDRRAVDDLVAAVRRAPTFGGAIIRRITLAGTHSFTQDARLDP